MPGKLLGDVLRRRWMARQIVEHSAALVDAGIGVAPAEHRLLAGLMQTAHENEFTAMCRVVRPGPRPTGKDLGEICYVGRAIAATNSKRMQFQGLARQVFIETLVAVDARDRIRTHRLDVVQIKQHRWMALHRLEETGKTAEHMRTLGLALIGAHHRDIFVGGYAEMIRPEPH